MVEKHGVEIMMQLLSCMHKLFRNIGYQTIRWSGRRAQGDLLALNLNTNV